MMAQLSLLHRFPIAGDRARVDHVTGLDAFLNSHASAHGRSPAHESVHAPVQADWTAPLLAAALVYDTAAHRLPSGIRALVQEGTRRLMFVADEYEIVLHVAANDGSAQVGLVGQLLYQGLPLADRWVRIVGVGAPTVGATGRAGAFHLPGLDDGVYGLEIAVGPYVLTASGISLPHQEAQLAEIEEKRCVRTCVED
jgi:hypothetical protein